MRFISKLLFVAVFINMSISDILSHGPTRQKLKESITISRIFGFSTKNILNLSI